MIILFNILVLVFINGCDTLKAVIKSSKHQISVVVLSVCINLLERELVHTQRVKAETMSPSL